MSKHISLASYELEAAARAEGYAHVCGADEAGAGPLMGPVYAAAVILPEGCVIEGLDDSKKLSEKKREALFDIIRERAVAYSVASVDAREIDEIDILNARMKAMQLAIDGLNVKADFALIDGDGVSMSIAAASILAKVSRDRFVTDVLDKQYPQYQFARHKGYGTKLHYAMLDEYGPCPCHRRTFLKKWEAGRP